MTRPHLILTLACLFCVSSAMADSVFSPVYLDGALEGFNSNDAPHAASTADGNPGTTLGEQRRWAFERALEYWELRLDSNVVIEVAAEMNDLSCSFSGAVLGSAGPDWAYADWVPSAGGSSPAFANTVYPSALANRLANRDLDVDYPDIGATFNKQIDESDGCLFQTSWYYALGEAPSGTISFFATALHEIGHGIGFLTFVDKASGSRLWEMDDIYMKFLLDHSTGKLWPDMTDSERAASATDPSDLHWVGPNVMAALGPLTGGVSDGHAHMYAPETLEGGSSVSHWDTAIEDSNGNHELMEPSATGSEKLLITGELLQDIGWNDVPANDCNFASYRLTLSSLYSGTNEHNACVSVTYDGALIYEGDTTATAGREVVLKNGFTVEQGATFRVQTDPNIGL
ncbi:hypothetical protein [Gilvimarinus algae]|uniref:Uncharacterized protein n=1 Tax=Gilvimarinus algae TaxID=3058037 RepID=A0ABT8TLK9_9GAMM|nr:hypothetical protein [Gilvimarinus sp. SDUM040014]MDO3383247.1 hypothetical protein [Gilvimarinus sp. SDUM040014]